MKKIIFLLSMISLLTACSSDSDSFTSSPENQKSYPVTFNVANPVKITGESLLKSSNKVQKISSMQIVIFNEKGDYLLDYVYHYGNKQDWVQGDDSAKFNLTLFKGTYYVAFFTTTFGGDESPAFGGVKLIDIDSKRDKNFFTTDSDFEGTYGYYESVKITVVESTQIQESDVELQPMWSNLNLAITDAKTFDAPEGTDAIQFELNPLYIGFKLDNKLAVNKAPKDFFPSLLENHRITKPVISLDSIRKMAPFIYKTCVYQTLPENGDLAITLKYLDTKSKKEPIILGTRDLEVPKITIENGYNYNIKGTLGKKESNQAFSITLGEFNNKEINF